MNQMQYPLVPFVGPALLIATLAVVGFYICRRYTGLTRWQSVLLWLLAIGLTVGFRVYLLDLFRYERFGESFTYARQIYAILLPLLTVPFITRLYRKWIDGHLTEAEKLPGIDGVRAWLGVGNVICAVLIPLCVQGALGPLPMAYQPVTLIPLIFGLLLAYPLLNMASHSAQPAPAVPTEDLSKEREKVLQLLEAGKINPVESAELLNALAHSAPPTPKLAAEINPQRKMVLIGATVLLVGFFLPWFSINRNAMVNEMTTQIQQSMNGLMPADAMPRINLPDGTVQVHAGNIPNGLGWWILALGIAAAVLPFFATTLEASMQKKVILAALGVGAILLIYLLSDTLRYVSFGILLALAGYVLEVVGTLKERPSAR